MSDYHFLEVVLRVKENVMGEVLNGDAASASSSSSSSSSSNTNDNKQGSSNSDDLVFCKSVTLKPQPKNKKRLLPPSPPIDSSKSLLQHQL